MLLKFRSRIVEVTPNKSPDEQFKVRETQARLFAGNSKDEEPIAEGAVRQFSMDQDEPAVAQEAAFKKALYTNNVPREQRTEAWGLFWNHSKRTAALRERKRS